MQKQVVDARVKPGHDEKSETASASDRLKLEQRFKHLCCCKTVIGRRKDRCM